MGIEVWIFYLCSALYIYIVSNLLRKLDCPIKLQIIIIILFSFKINPDPTFDEPLESSTWIPIESSKHLQNVWCEPLMRVFRTVHQKIEASSERWCGSLMSVFRIVYRKFEKHLQKVRCRPLLFQDSTPNVQDRILIV
jgi:hypothetical protein